MNVTIKDIAAYTGLSVSTVSVVLNGKADDIRISKKTIARIEEASTALNYKPNMLASCLRKGFTKTIGIVVSDVSFPFFTKLASIIEREVSKLGYRVYIASSNENDEDCLSAIESFINFRVDGLVIAPTGGLKERIIELSRQEIPFVLLDRYFSGVNVNTVLMDNYKSSYDAVDYLIKKGRKRIATFSYETNLRHMSDRMDGYRGALKANGIRFDKRLTPSIPFLDIDSDFVKESIRCLVEKHDADAIFFQTHRTALPGLMAIQELDYKVPEQLAVFCYHDNSLFNLMKPSITSQRQPLEEMARECANLLLLDIQGKLPSKEKKVYPSTEIYERESC